MRNDAALEDDKFQEIIRRVVAVARPERVILFGSAARGEMTVNSDVDLLVVMNGEFDYGKVSGDIYMNLIGVGQAVDVVLATAEQVDKYRDVDCLVIAPALREGREVYVSREPISASIRHN